MSYKLKEITINSDKVVMANDEIIGYFLDTDWGSDLLWFKPTGHMQIGVGFSCTKSMFEFDVPTALTRDLTEYIEKCLTNHINLLTEPNVN